MTSVAFTTLGCKVNQYDTDVMKTSFIKRGYSIVNDSEKADIYIINTCTVTGMAARKSRQMTGRARKTNPESLVVVTGCLGQLESEDVMEMTDADIVTGNIEKDRIVDLIEEYSGSEIVKTGDIFSDTIYSQDQNSTQGSRTRIFIKVQDGCDNFCSYCTIPFARGRSRSREKEKVIEEIQTYANKGVREIVITGIHLDSYGKDFDNYRLIDLLEQIEGIAGITRIRLGSLEPASITSDFIARAAKLKKLCPHFHLSLQSGCDKTLERMKRRYTSDEFIKAVELIKKGFKNAALTTDIIVGFPGETEEEFNITKQFAEAIGFMKIHVFRFSARKGTLAYGMKNKVPGDIKKQRSEVLTKISDKGFKDFVKTIYDKEHEVIAEKISDKHPEYWEGHTKNYVKVLFKSPGCTAGEAYFVKFSKIGDDFVFSALHKSTGV